MTSWRARAEVAILELALSGEPFTSDDLLQRVGPPDSTHASNSRNSAIGSLFGEYSRRGRIVAVGVERSHAPHRKSGMVRVWRGAAK